MKHDIFCSLERCRYTKEDDFSFECICGCHFSRSVLIDENGIVLECDHFATDEDLNNDRSKD